jgi:ketosteroid isomerase-like protein
MAGDRQDAQDIAQRLRSAFEARDLEGLGDLLAPDVRWGGEEDTAQTCHSRADVLAWYGDLHARGVRASVVEASVEPHRVVLTLDVSRPGGGTSRNYQAFRIADGRIVDIRDHGEAPAGHP